MFSFGEGQWAVVPGPLLSARTAVINNGLGDFHAVCHLGALTRVPVGKGFSARPPFSSVILAAVRH